MLQHNMSTLEGWLRSLGPMALSFRNDAAPKLVDLKAELLEIFSQIEGIQNKADAEGRALLDEEKTELADLWASHEALEEDIGRREKIEDAGQRLAKSYGRKTLPSDTSLVGQPDDETPMPAARMRLPARPASPEDRGKWGWQNFGQFATSVYKAVRTYRDGSGAIDPRLVANAPTSFGTEGTGEEGGFAVPPDFRTAILEKVMGEDSLLSRTDQLTSGSNTAVIPVDNTTPWQTSGGILAYWEGEAGQMTQSKPLLQPRSVRLNKIYALVPVSDELLEDAPMMDSYLRRKAPEKMDYKISDALFNGDGVGKPLGLLNSDSLISVSAESGQAGDTVVAANIHKMYSRMYAPWRNSAVWMINQDVEPQLLGLNLGSQTPLFLPAGGLSASPFGTILGRPIVPHEVCQTVGDVGDIVFVSWAQYMTIRKVGGIRVDTSMHLFFDYDLTAFRFILRIAGEPWWNSAITRANGTNTLSWAVALAART